ncbi:MAG TPA: CoA pyrophosphatase [Longimicrobiales bacterium]
MVLDARLIRLRRGFEGRPARRLPRSRAGAEAAVALVLRARSELELLLIKRAEHEADPWSGHMALPGGRRDPGDADLIATAFRETAEETGIPLARIGQPLGALDEVRPGNPRLPPITIAPFVIGVPPDTTATPDPREVDAALWVPLPALRDPAAVSEILVDLEEGSRAYPSLRFGEYVIWGLTHRILVQFLELADACGVIGGEAG